MPTRCCNRWQAWVPATYAAFQDYRMGAVTLSAGMLAVVRRRLAGEAVDQAASGLSASASGQSWRRRWPRDRGCCGILVFGSINVDTVLTVDRMQCCGLPQLGWTGRGAALHPVRRPGRAFGG